MVNPPHFSRAASALAETSNERFNRGVWSARATSAHQRLRNAHPDAPWREAYPAHVTEAYWVGRCGPSLGNAGHGTAHFGLKTVEELEATKGEPFRIADLPGLQECEEVVAINVNRRWAEVKAQQSTLLDISRGSWKLNKARADRCRFAIIHANGIVRGVFIVKRWIGPDSDGRFTFEPLHEEPIQGAAFSQKNASSLFGAAGSGSQNPIRYVAFTQ